MERPDPGQLAETIKDMSDAELEQQVMELGPDQVLEAIFDGMQQAYKPEASPGLDAVVEYDIKTNGEVQEWHAVMKEGKCVTAKGPGESPRLTLEVGLVDFIRLIFGQVEGPQLFMSGRLKLKGDMMFGMQLPTLFSRDF